MIIHFYALKYIDQNIGCPPFFFSAVADFNISEGVEKNLEEIQVQLSHRKVWMASSIHKGEEEGKHDILDCI